MCHGKWEYSSSEPHGLNVGKEWFPPKQNCVLLSREGVAHAGQQISHRCPSRWWWGGGGRDHQVPRPASWGPFSWFRKLHEISTGSASRTWLNSRGQSEADSEWIPDLWHPLSLWSKETMGSQKWHLHLTSSQPQEWHIRVMWSKRDWQTLWLKKRERQDCVLCFLGFFSPENPICSHSNQVPLRFGWISFLRLLQQASEPLRC